MNSRGDNPLDVLVIAASPVRRSCLGELAAGVSDSRVSTAQNLSLERLLSSFVDVVVVDLDAPGLASAVMQAAQRLRGNVGIVALVDDPDSRWLASALNAGINAVLSREIAPDELRLAIETAEAGLVLLHPASVPNLAGQRLSLSTGNEPGALGEELTSRELQVLRLVSEGLGNKEIARRLNISDHTVKFHVSSILGKLGAASRAEAVSQGIRKGFITI
jgi:DNA-binding NarL/FixJ family response regulator